MTIIHCHQQRQTSENPAMTKTAFSRRQWMGRKIKFVPNRCRCRTTSVTLLLLGSHLVYLGHPTELHSLLQPCPRSYRISSTTVSFFQWHNTLSMSTVWDTRQDIPLSFYLFLYFCLSFSLSFSPSPLPF